MRVLAVKGAVNEFDLGNALFDKEGKLFFYEIKTAKAQCFFQ